MHSVFGQWRNDTGKRPEKGDIPVFASRKRGEKGDIPVFRLCRAENGAIPPIQNPECPLFASFWVSLWYLRQT